MFVQTSDFSVPHIHWVLLFCAVPASRVSSRVKSSRTESMSRQYHALTASSLPLEGWGSPLCKSCMRASLQGILPQNVLRQASWILEEWQEALCHVQTVPRLTKWPPWPPSCLDPPPLSHSQSPCFVKPMSALLSTSLKLSTSQPSTATHSVPSLLWWLLPPVIPVASVLILLQLMLQTGARWSSGNFSQNLSLPGSEPSIPGPS